MMTDFFLLETISRLNSINPRPRLLHQKGAAARGWFYPYMRLADYTRADFLQDPERATPVIARFSRTMGAIGSGDSLRDTHGFAVRFQTRDGDYDLLGQDMPCYYINRPDKFPELVEMLSPVGKYRAADSAAGQDRRTDETGFWPFLARNPEAVNLALWLYTERGTRKSYRSMEGYSITTCKWVNEQGIERYIRYHWRPLCEGDEQDEARVGISYQEAEFLAGFSPDCCLCDLALALAEERWPSYELEVQLMEMDQAVTCGFDHLSATLQWPEEEFPYLKIGRMTLREMLSPEEEDGLCFVPADMVAGICPAGDEFAAIMACAHRDGGRQRGAVR